MSKPAIEVDDVTVEFRPFVDKKPTLRRSIAHLRSKERTTVTALNGVSFDVNPGEAFGIIGKNGAGKSTLLKVIAGTLRPDSGRVTVRGKASTLLALGVGFNPALSGRKNVYLGGLAAGLRRTEIEDLFDDIVEYAELGEAIDRPMNTYSSGMFSRLAFSVGMHLEPDILLLDEVLAVGDLSFREKSMQAMEDLLARSGTIVFVSHALTSVADFCDRAMWLSGGQILELGEAGDVVDAYRTTAQERRRKREKRQELKKRKAAKEARATQRADGEV